MKVFMSCETWEKRLKTAKKIGFPLFTFSPPTGHIIVTPIKTSSLLKVTPYTRKGIN